jgi:hypothetical protein
MIDVYEVIRKENHSGDIGSKGKAIVFNVGGCFS